jgi:Flp pilus assembly protein TadD
MHPSHPKTNPQILSYMAIPNERPLLESAIAAVERNDLENAEARFKSHFLEHRENPIGLAGYGDFCLRTGRPESARYLLSKACMLDPGATSPLAQLGYARLELREYDTARRSFERALDLAPDDAVAAYGLAMCHVQHCEWRPAIAAFEKALASQPDTPSILLDLAHACCMDGDAGKASLFFRNVLRLTPNDPDVLLEYAKFLREQGDASSAIRLVDSAIGHQGETSSANIEKARCLLMLGHPAQAMRLLETTEAIAPGDPDLHEVFGDCLDRSGNLPARDLHWIAAIDRWIRDSHFSRAEPLLNRLLQSSPDNGGAWNMKGLLENSRHDAKAAEAAFLHAIAVDRSDLDAYANLANLYETTNRIADARAVSDDGLRFATSNSPQKDAVVQLLLANAKVFRRLGDRRTSLDRLDALDAMDLSGVQRQFACFERGKLLDLSDDASGAIAAFAAGNAIALDNWLRETPGNNKFRAGVEYLLDPANKRWIEEWMPIEALADSPRDVAFLIGFPRSGTTLLNQVLDSHDAIQAMEEQPPAQDVMNAVRAVPEGYPFALRSFDRHDVEYLRDIYFRSVALHEGDGGTKLLLDKFPLHTTMAGLLHRVFPGARFVFAIRHPCDVVLSCFMQNFKVNDAMANFCTIEDTVGLYARTMDLWQMCREQLPLMVHAIRYEDVVDDFDGQIRALCEFLQVPWEDSLRQFSKRALDRGRINTPSYEQVSKPIYREARYRWERYREHFEPFLPALRPYILQFGYEDPLAGN